MCQHSEPNTSPRAATANSSAAVPYSHKPLNLSWSNAFFLVVSARTATAFWNITKTSLVQEGKASKVSCSTLSTKLSAVRVSGSSSCFKYSSGRIAATTCGGSKNWTCTQWW